MDDKYNDYLLMSPEQMEIIAKKYKNQIENKNKLKEVAIKRNICSLLHKLISYYETLKFVCPLKYYKSNKEIINKHKNILFDIYVSFNDKEIYDNKPIRISYFKILKEIVNDLISLFEIYWNELKDSYKARVVFSLIKQIINLR